MGAFDLWERANARLTSEIDVLSALTESFQYGIDGDRFGLDPSFQLVILHYSLDPPLLRIHCYIYDSPKYSARCGT